MTVVAALVTPDGTVYMASDAQSTDGHDLTYQAERKISRVPVGRHDEALIGLAGPSGMHHRVADQVGLPVAPDPDDPTDLAKWAAAVAENLHTVISEAPKTIGGSPDDDYRSYAALLAHAGRLWLLTDSGQCVTIHRRYHAIGSGQQVALGALNALLRGVDPDAHEQTVNAAVHAAIEHRADCGGPVRVEILHNSCGGGGATQQP